MEDFKKKQTCSTVNTTNSFTFICYTLYSVQKNKSKNMTFKILYVLRNLENKDFKMGSDLCVCLTIKLMIMEDFGIGRIKDRI